MPAIATSGTIAKPAAISVSHSKYRFHPSASCSLRLSSSLRGSSARSSWATCESIVMCVSCSRGRMGPSNCGLVGITWPKRSSCPGPDKLSDGSAAPTSAVWPAADTCCIGATFSASQIDPTVMIPNVST